MTPSLHAQSRPVFHIETKLAEIWAQILGLEKVGFQDDFFELGGDSLAAADLVVQVQKVFGLTLSLTILMQAPTVESLAGVIRRHNGVAAWSSVVELQPQGSRPPFFCVHPVGGEILCFVNLAREMAPDQPFYGICADRAGEVERTAPHIKGMAARYIEEIRRFQPDGPYFLGGYSFGGSVAFEMAQQLTAQGQNVALLAILDHTPPPARYYTPFGTPAFLMEFLRNTPSWLLDEISNARLDETLARLRLKTGAVRRRIGAFLDRPSPGSTASDAEGLFDLSRMPEPFRNLLEAHYRALREYVPTDYPGRVTLFRARTRPLLRLHGRDLGWSRLAAGGLEIIEITGNHHSILSEPHVRVLAQRLRFYLEKAQATNERFTNHC